jgi:serine phosphatase RsbU (regulator of sigma subunit)
VNPGPGDPAIVPPVAVPAPWQALLDQVDGYNDRHWYTSILRDAKGEIIGGVAVGNDEALGPFTEEDIDVMRRFNDAMTVALANLRSFAEEHRIALALQSAMLPARLSGSEHLVVAARYLASDAMLAVGGDFYDGFTLPDGRTALVVGDVQGHSLRAAIVMGELRTTLRAYLYEGHPPDHAIELLDAALRASHPEFVTACVCVVDTTTGQVEVVNAGHLPPLVLGVDGSTRFVRGGSRILGLAVDEPRKARMDQLLPGDTLVLVTDGLLERRDVSLRDNIDLMAKVAGDAADLSTEDLCDELLRRFDADREDDIAVLAARWHGPAR